MTALVQLVAKETDNMGYVTYVFKCLEDEMIKHTQYIMCVRYPNWDHRSIKLREIGYLDFVEIRAGVDKWFDGNKMIPYNYNNIQFIKFISKPEENNYKYVI